jgi:hypothetical protein
MTAPQLNDPVHYRATDADACRAAIVTHVYERMEAVSLVVFHPGGIQFLEHALRNEKSRHPGTWHAAGHA